MAERMPTQRGYQGEPSAGQDVARCVHRHGRACLHGCVSGSLLSDAPQKDTQEAGAWVGGDFFKLVPYIPMLFVSHVSIIQFRVTTKHCNRTF